MVMTGRLVGVAVAGMTMATLSVTAAPQGGAAAPAPAVSEAPAVSGQRGNAPVAAPAARSEAAGMLRWVPSSAPTRR